MKEIILRAKSSNNYDFHNVTFINEGGIIKIKCDCRAGIFSWVCRHKIGLMRGDAKYLFDDAQKELLKEVVNWISNSSFPKLIDEYNKIENEFNLRKKELNKIEERLEEKKFAIYNDKSTNINDKDNKTDKNGNVFRFDLLKIFLKDVKNRDQKYYDEINPYNNPEFVNIKNAFSKIEMDFKSIKSVMKSAMKNGA
jgi:hypothetical protein